MNGQKPSYSKVRAWGSVLGTPLIIQQGFVMNSCSSHVPNLRLALANSHWQSVSQKIKGVGSWHGWTQNLILIQGDACFSIIKEWANVQGRQTPSPRSGNLLLQAIRRHEAPSTKLEA